MLKRDRKWEIHYGDISIEQFVERLPIVVFKKIVNSEVANAFVIVYQLLIHSYYQYLFVDIAVTKALHIFEMALCNRYRELNNGKEWKGKLNGLIDWFNERSYFEVADKRFLDHVRTTRNRLTHPKGFDFKSSVGLPWINTVVDLINGLYEDIELRKYRWKRTEEYKSKMDLFLEKGAKLTFLDRAFYIYDSGLLKVENRPELPLCYFSLLPLFEIDITTPKIPFLFNYPADNLKFDGPIIELSFGTKKITLSNELNLSELDLIEKFRIRIRDEEEYRIQNSMLIFDAGNTIRKSISESLTNNIMLEQEFEFEVKINATLETNRDRPPTSS